MNQIAKLEDTHQSSWQLAMIQLAGWTSLPIIATSILVLEGNSLWGAIATIVVGNAILWFLRIGMIAMSQENRWSTLDLSSAYLGKIGSYFIAILLLISTFAWFIQQTTAAGTTLTRLITIHENKEIDQFTQMSVFLGIASAFLCMEGMVLLKRLSVIVFPILALAFFAILFTLPPISSHINDNRFSLSGLTLILATNLGITSDLPTFFRHSRSLFDSVKAITAIQIISLGLGLCSLYFGSIISRGFEINDRIVLSPDHEMLRIALIVFVFLSVITANVANVYSASVGWELVAPTALVGRKEYLIMGLGLTTIYILVANLLSLDYLLNVSDGALVNLCLVLILGYILSLRLKRSPTSVEQTTYFIAWLLASIFNTLQFAGVFLVEVSPFVVSLSSIIVVIALSFIGMRIKGLIK